MTLITKFKRAWLFAWDQHRFAVVCMLISWLAVLFVGSISPIPMVGDEVTHYYMMTRQAEVLPQANFASYIPIAYGDYDYEVRRYAHAFFWHYSTAIVHRLTGGSTFCVQLFHSLFFLQMMLSIYGLSGLVRGTTPLARKIVLLAACSLPLSLLFSVTYYQDVPAAAQVLTAFYFLMRRRYWCSSLFMAMAMGVKETTILFLPVFFLLLVFLACKDRVIKSAVKAFFPIVVSLGLVFWLLTFSLWNYAGEVYYPYQRLLKAVSAVSGSEVKPPTAPYQESFEAGLRKDENGGKINIAINENQNMRNINHPGNLKNPINWMIYGGGLIYILVAAAGIGFWRPSSPIEDGIYSPVWFYLAGLTYIVITAMMLHEVPDARFFVGGIYLCLVPLAVLAARIPFATIFLILFSAGSFLQGSMVLYKLHHLRYVPKGIHAAINYLDENPLNPNRVFMYPEGNYRLFPSVHEWYFNDRLIEDVWQVDTDTRFKKFVSWDISAVVVKKYLIGDLDENFSNLSVYPRFFVEELEKDPRYTKVLENDDVLIYTLPPQHSQ